MRSAESAVAEIDHLLEAYGANTLKIIDAMFVLNYRHVEGICNLLAAKP